MKMVKVLMSEEIEKELASILREEVDREILTEIKIADLCSQGWTQVAVSDTVSFKNIEPWIEANIRDEWRAYDARWLFRDTDDAMLFKLTWCE